MKKTQRKMFRRSMAVLLSAMMAATSGNVGSSSVLAAQKSVSMNYSAYTLKKGSTVNLKLNNVSSKKKVIWKSSRKTVATVNEKGVVTAVKKGKTVITAKVKGTNLKASCKVTVGTPVKKLTVSKKNITLTVGASKKIAAVVTPADASNKTLAYKSSKTSVASVNANGKVTAKKEGTAKITVSTTDGSKKTAVVKVTVKAAASDNSTEDNTAENTNTDTNTNTNTNTNTTENTNTDVTVNDTNNAADDKTEDTTQEDNQQGSSIFIPGGGTVGGGTVGGGTVGGGTAGGSTGDNTSGGGNETDKDTPSDTPSEPENPEVVTTVTNSAVLAQALAQTSNLPDRILFRSDAEETIEIPASVEMPDVILEVDAKNATITNKGSFETVKIDAIASHTWIEAATGNLIDVVAVNAHVKVASTGSVNIRAGEGVQNLKIENDGVISGMLVETTTQDASIVLTGSSIDAVPVSISSIAANPRLETSLPVNMEAESRITLQLRNGAEENSNIVITNTDAVPSVQCNMLGGIQITVRRENGSESTTEILAETIPGDNWRPEGESNIIGTVRNGATSAPVSSAAVYMIPYSLDVDSLNPDLADDLAEMDRAIAAAEAQDSCYITQTDPNGQYSMTVPRGNYCIIVKADDLQNVITRVIASDTTVQMQPISMLEPAEGTGSVSGTITDAATGLKVTTELHLYLRKGATGNVAAEVVDDLVVTNGSYTFENVPAGNYTIEVVDERNVEEKYVATVFHVLIVENVSVTQNTTITKVIEDGQLRFILQWSEEKSDDSVPSDLDSHLVGPSFEGGKFHTYFSDKVYTSADEENTAYVEAIEDNATVRLDVDDTDYIGPETTTVYKISTDGEYHFYIHNYSDSYADSTTLSTSGAWVNVYLGAVKLNTFYVPVGVGNVWDVCAYNPVTQELTAGNRIIYVEDYCNIGLSDEDIVQLKINGLLSEAAYSGGVVEEIVNQMLAECRDEITIANVYEQVGAIKDYMYEIEGLLSKVTRRDEDVREIVNQMFDEIKDEITLINAEEKLQPIREYVNRIDSSTKIIDVVSDEIVGYDIERYSDYSELVLYTFAQEIPEDMLLTIDYEGETEDAVSYEVTESDDSYYDALIVVTNTEVEAEERYYVKLTVSDSVWRPESITVNNEEVYDWGWGYGYDEDDNEYCYLRIYDDAETLDANAVSFNMKFDELTTEYETLEGDDQFVGKLTVTHEEGSSRVFYIKYVCYCED